MTSITSIRNLRPPFAKFVVVGGLNTLLDFLVYNLVLFFLVIEPLALLVAIAKTVGFSTAVVNSFIFNRYWTFTKASHEEHMLKSRQQFIRFYLISISGMLGNVTITTVLAAILHNNSELSELWLANLAFLAGTTVTVLFNFYAYKHLVFHVR